MTFAVLLCGFLITKFWQDTLMLSVSTISPYLGLASALIRKSVVFSAIGLTTGSMIVGPINDRFGPKKTFPLFLIMTSFFNIMLLFPMQIYILRTVLLLRSISLAGAINNTYVGTSLLYKGDRLPKMTSILYMSLFGLSSLFPIIFTWSVNMFSFKVLTISSAITSTLVAFYLFSHLPNKKPIYINLQTFKIWKNFLTNSKFVAMSAVSMICIGGFYGFIAVYAYQFSKTPSGSIATFSKFIITLGIIQGVGRLCTFLTSSLCSVKLNMSNIGKYLSLSMFSISIGMFWMFISAFFFDKIVAFGVFGFLLSCLAMGIAQPATKLGLLTIFKDSAGSGQSLVGIGNSMYEVIAMIFVFNFPYQPFGGYLYVLITSFLTLILGIYFKKMKSI